MHCQKLVISNMRKTPIPPGSGYRNPSLVLPLLEFRLPPEFLTLSSLYRDSGFVRNPPPLSSLSRDSGFPRNPHIRYFQSRGFLRRRIFIASLSLETPVPAGVSPYLGRR